MNRLTGAAIAAVFALCLTAAPCAHAAMHGEKHPKINGAIYKLEHAKEDLNKAAHDFGGHRAAAIQHIDAALAELHQALEYDAHHDDHH
ncbi:MAG: hypothetical protein KGL10_09030 [Alphaproteobacteria bacterium]|nr:hypothetical protein [Alphaproteobacteria bacterium]MDE2337441.1 hypothetical protein [Alphaproteobacteria bacterium]